MIRAIHAEVHGRVRFVVDGLYRSDFLKRHLETHLPKEPGILSSKANLLTGHLLVLYNGDHTCQSVQAVVFRIVAEVRSGGNLPGNAGAPGEGPRPLSIFSIFAEIKAGRIIPPEKPKTEPERPSRSRVREKIATIKNFLGKGEPLPEEPWHLQDGEAVLKTLESSPAEGLTSQRASRNLKKFGANVLPEALRRSGLSIFFSQFRSLPVALLGAAAAVSIVTGGLADALVILGVVCINGAIGYFTEKQSEKTIHSLKRLVHPSAVVLRDGKPSQIPGAEVALGDILILRNGTYVPADARLLEAHHLSIDESALTGESMPVLKTPLPLAHGGEIPLADRTNMIYMGTLVTGGQGLAVVTATGGHTEMGKIQVLAGEAHPPETPMEIQLRRMGNQLVLICGLVCGGVFLLGLLRGYGFLQMLKTSISLAVAAVPEGLPTVATTTLALGIRNMRRHRVLIRHLEAVETLGCVQTICLDKTGTLTRNQMTLVAIHAGLSRFRIENHQMRLVYTFSGRDTPPLSQSPAEEKIDPYRCDELLKILHVTVLCSESQVAGEKGTYVVTGTPTENALVQAALGCGVDVPTLRETHPLQKIFHRSENRNLMISLHGNHGAGGVIAVKGSPREVLALCQSYWKDGKTNSLSEEERLGIENENDRMAEEGLRVLGVAYGFTEDAPVIMNGNVEAILEENLVWVGLVGLADPLRGGVREVIRSFHGAGIDTVMITGDQSPTAYAVGKALNLSNSANLEIMDSTHIADMDRGIMKALSQRVQIFSRVSPAHKLQIVQALQASGKIVAMTGDGINDGPALKAANIGISMGQTGTDVAREVADVILEDDNLETMIVAISQGRTIYNNIRKSLHFLLATNLSEIILMAGAMGAGLGQPLNTIQLLWINLMSDVFPALALSLELPEPDILTRPPRDPQEPIIRREDFKRILFESGVLAAGGMGAYLWGVARYGPGPQASTMGFLSLTTGQILHAFSCRSDQSTVFDNGKRPANPYLNAAVGGTLLLQAMAFVIPGLRNLLGLAPLSAADYGIALGGSVLPLLVNEITKKKRRRKGTSAGPGRPDASSASAIPLPLSEIFPQR